VVFYTALKIFRQSLTQDYRSMYSSGQRYFAEFIGTAFLLATVIGSGIMAENLSGGNVAIALLGNTIPTGAILVILITMLGPISGAHFNPAVTLVFAIKKDISAKNSLIYFACQITGGLAGAMIAHAMFDLDLLQTSEKLRTGSAQWISEWVATFGLVFTILATLRAKQEAVAMAVGLYITAAYWFTASTSFANPAVTVARSFTNTFSGISPEHVSGFIIAQLIGAISALAVCHFILRPKN
jgi:glycerol uptake facilitator-like aquaporin